MIADSVPVLSLGCECDFEVIVMSMLQIVVGILIIALGCWQLYASRNVFHRLRTSGGPETSPFIAYGLWYGFLFGILLIGAGIGVLFFNL